MDAASGSEHVEELALEPVAVVRKPQPRALWAVLAAVGGGRRRAGGHLRRRRRQPASRPARRPGRRGSGAGGAEAAADSSMLAWVTYVPGDDLPALGGEATAYRLAGDVDEAQVRAARRRPRPRRRRASPTAPDRGRVAGRWRGRLDVYAGGGAYWSYFAGDQDCVTGRRQHRRAAAIPASSARRSTRRVVAIDGRAASAPTLVEPSTARRCADRRPTIVDPALPAPAATLHADCADRVPCDAGADCVEPGAMTGRSVTCPARTRRARRPRGGGRQRRRRRRRPGHRRADGESRTGSSRSSRWSTASRPASSSYVEVSDGRRRDLGQRLHRSARGAGRVPAPRHPRRDRPRQRAVGRAGIEPALGDREATSSATGGDDAVDDDRRGRPPIRARPRGRCRRLRRRRRQSTDAALQGAARRLRDLRDRHVRATTATVGDDVVATTVRQCARRRVPRGGRRRRARPRASTAAADPVDRRCRSDPGAAAARGRPGRRRAVAGAPARHRRQRRRLPRPGLPLHRRGRRHRRPPRGRRRGPRRLRAPPRPPCPTPIEPDPVPVPEPQPCEVLEEGDSSGTTHTDPDLPHPDEDRDAAARRGAGDRRRLLRRHRLAVHWRVFELGDQVVDAPTTTRSTSWARPGEPHEGGTFTLDAEDHGTFVGDAEPGTQGRRPSCRLEVPREADRPLCDSDGLRQRPGSRAR